MKHIILPLSVLFLLIYNYGCKQKNVPIIVSNDYVPNIITAIKIAEAIWLPIYGDIIYDEKPFVATLKNDSIWVVQGSLEDGKSGGIAYIEIQKKDGKILNVTHGK